MSEKVYVNICDTKKCPGPVYAVKTGDTAIQFLRGPQEHDVLEPGTGHRFLV